MRLLHLDASARRQSISRRLSSAFRTEWEAASAQHTTTYRDLATDAVPPISEAWTEICDNLLRDQISDLDQLHLGVRTPAQKEAWQVLEPLLDEVIAADVILIGTPMYNFGVPASLKAWIDQITFPRMKLGHRRFVIAAARGGTYLPGTPREPFEHHVRYLTDFVQGHYSVPAPTVIVAELTNATVDPSLATLEPAHQASVEAALAEARRSARALTTPTRGPRA